MQHLCPYDMNDRVTGSSGNMQKAVLRGTDALFHFGIGLAEFTLPGFTYSVTHNVYEREWPEMPGKLWDARCAGKVSMRRRPEDPEHDRFIRLILKILNSVSTSRLVYFDARSGEVRAPDRPFREHRVGHHAARWALESDRRYFECFGAGGLLRPEG